MQKDETTNMKIVFVFFFYSTGLTHIVFQIQRITCVYVHLIHSMESSESFSELHDHSLVSFFIVRKMVDNFI